MALTEGPDFVSLAAGVTGFFKGSAVRVLSLPEPDKVLLYNSETQKSELVPVHEFKLDSGKPATRQSVHDRSAEWDTADYRFSIIEPLVMREPGAARPTLAEVKTRATIAKVHFTTVYRWIREYDNSGRRPRGLMPKFKLRGSRRLKLDPVTESLLKQAIELYLSKQQPTLKAAHMDLKLLCDSAGIKTPHYNTLRHRINAIPEKEKLKRRSRAKQARERFELRPGSLTVERPWQLVQVDHTPTDVILVDEAHRRPIGKAFVTAAIDVYSRMIVGIYVSLERPDAQIAGLCLTRAMLPKKPFLDEIGSTIDWPCYGKPVTVHVDNAMEFHGKTLFRACQDNSIEQEFRPLTLPEYGGHIEAFMKTLMRKVHLLPGSTFFSVEHRAEYDSEAMAEKGGMSIREFECWLLDAIDEYHQSYHSGILETPMSRYRAAFGPRADGLPVIHPTIIKDPERLRIDFMPSENRTIQKSGVQFFNVRYAHSVLGRHVNATSGDRYRTKRQYRFHYDPRNISTIYFYDPDLKQYFPIPYANRANPPISKWERIEAHRHLVESGRSKVDERAIFDSIKRRRAIESEAAKKNKVARRNTERVKDSTRRTRLTLVPPPQDHGGGSESEPISMQPRIKRTLAVEEA